MTHLQMITWQAWTVVMREGIEALLALLGLELFLIQATAKNRALLYLGASLAVLVALPISALAAAEVAHEITGFFNAWLNLIMLVLAFVFLLFAAAFLADAPAIESPTWARSIAAISASHPWLIALVAFAIVYREGMEATIFLIVLNPTIDFDLGSLLWGVSVALVCLVGLYVALRASLRALIMVRPILLLVSAILFFLGLHFVGEAVEQMQKMGLSPATESKFEYFETLEAMIAQAIAAFAALALRWPRPAVKRPRAKS